MWCLLILTLLASNLLNASVANVSAPQRNWKLLQSSAGFDGRAGGSMYWNPISSRFVLHGVGVYDQDDAAIEDVYSGAANGRFSLMRVTKLFNPLYSAISTMDSNGVMYRIQGTDNAWNEHWDVWRSTDAGKSWIAQHEQRNSHWILQGTRALGAAAVFKSNSSMLVLIGGLSASNQFLDDVWLSPDSGLNWYCVPDKNTYFGPIALNSLFTTTMTVGADEVDAIYQIGGTSGSDKFYNDVWVSTGPNSNVLRNWVKVATALWQPRGAAFIDMTADGIIVVSGGMGSQSTYLNDVWASLDGGYAWGLCAKDAEYPDRVYPYAAFDSDGYLVIAGGREPTGDRLEDVWKSTLSFFDATEVALACSLLMPSCGTGLKCLPDSPGFKAGLWGVVCDACPNPPAPPTKTARE